VSRFDGEVVSVSELIERGRIALDQAVGKIAVEGEVFEFRGAHSSGHYYFKLRDAEASIDVKMWRGSAARGMRCQLQEGRAVLGIGQLDIWPKRGLLSFLLEEVHDLGAGDLARRFEELKLRLRTEGLFDDARKRTIPPRPRRVGLITAIPSAAAADVERTWQDLAAPFEVLRFPTRVQGEGAAAEIVVAMQAAVRAGAEVILLTRGGGSLEDLWAFNEELLVRAVASCPVPVLCAVGHETDFSLCDFAADLRCKTPTAGAAQLVEGWLRTRRALSQWGQRFQRAGADHFALMRERLLLGGQELAVVWRAERLRHRAVWEHARLALRAQRPDRRLARARQRVNENELRLGFAWQAFCARRQAALLRAARGLAAAGPRVRLAAHRERLREYGARLAAGSPTALLQRGYALVEAIEQPGYLRDAEQVVAGQSLRITLARGSVDAQVLHIYPEAKTDPASGSDLRE
jgi:exodeoxyribonuclease VII large subunit